MCGVNRYPIETSPVLRDAVDHALQRVCQYLVEGTPGPKNSDRGATSIGAAALAFFRNRISAPRDVSAAAAKELRAACDEVLKALY